MKILKIICAALFLCVLSQNAYALQVLSPQEGESVFVNISKSELNMIQFPFEGIRVYTSSQKLDIKVHGRSILVAMTDKNEVKPQEMFLSTPYGTYLLMLVPKSVPAETIIMNIARANEEEADDWERESDYVKRIKELVKALYLGTPPPGYAIKEEKSDTSVWESVEQTLTMKMVGSGMVGEIHDLTNHGNKLVRISENEFYREGILAVSISSNELAPQQKEQIYIVRRNMSK